MSVIITEETLQARVLHRDAMLLVLDKPAGIAVHAGPRMGKASDDNLEKYFDWLRFGLPRPPALVHRLDRDTSGCLVLGRHRQALRQAGELFASGKAEKIYYAICAGVPEPRSGTIRAALRKKNDQVAGWEMIVVPDEAAGAQAAVTTFRTLAATATHSLVEFRPRTGRTHQIRIHAAHSGFPLVGDPRYFDGLSEVDRRRPLCLHARVITLPFYKNKPALKVEAPLPEAFLAVARQLSLDSGVAYAP